MQVCFAHSRRESVNSAAHARDCSTVGEKFAFMARSWASHPWDLHNFLPEQLIATQICINSRLNSLLLGKFAQILLGGLAGRIVQSWSLASYQRGLHNSWREDCLPSINVQFSRGSYSACSWTKSGWAACEGNGSILIYRLPLCEENTEAWILDEARQIVV